jgi:hypothetical protein
VNVVWKNLLLKDLAKLDVGMEDGMWMRGWNMLDDNDANFE